LVCDYFGKCGSCTLYNEEYKEQVKNKVSTINNLFDIKLPLEVNDSLDNSFRSKVEFRIFHKDNVISYAMNDIDKKILLIKSCSIINQHIQQLMPRLLKYIEKNEILCKRLFSIEFLSSFYTGEMLVSLIYHKKIDTIWEEEAKLLQEEFPIFIVGRSRRVKKICSQDYIQEKLYIDKEEYFFNIYEGAFSQANTQVNEKMISFVLNNNKKTKKDLLELYCGNGNFTIPLSKRFTKVLATEISKSSIKCAKENMLLNNVDNISFARLSSSETVQALDKVREFRRLRHLNLQDYDFSTIFLDPPRAGLDDETLLFAKRFDNITYISCNIDTLFRDYQLLIQTHKVTAWAFFDQFAYTNHIEMGLIFKK
jgi:tRNA (uracil-5-)-methyltransferase